MPSASCFPSKNASQCARRDSFSSGCVVTALLALWLAWSARCQRVAPCPFPDFQLNPPVIHKLIHSLLAAVAGLDDLKGIESIVKTPKALIHLEQENVGVILGICRHLSLVDNRFD